MYEILKYSDETDRSLGVVGMAIALLACDGEDYVARVSVECGESSIEFSQDAFYTTNPRLSAKIAWNQLIKEYHIFSGMLLGNVFCRRKVASKLIEDELISMLYGLVAEQGSQNCMLEDDEIKDMFNNDLRYFQRLFSHPGVIEVARDFASTLRLHRRMTAGEIFENLNRLSF